MYEEFAIPEYKAIIIGDSGVGKTTLLCRLKNGIFDGQINSTLGADFYDYNSTVDGKALKVNIYDTAGQEAYRSITKFYFSFTDIALVCFNPITNNWKESVQEWVDILHDEQINSPIIFVATKCDIWFNKQQTTSNVNNFITSKYKNCRYYQCSSKTGEGIEEIFNQVAKICIQGTPKKSSASSLFLEPGPSPPPPQQSCCS